MSAVRNEGGRAETAVKLIEGPGRKEEQEAGRALYGAYGTPNPGLLQKLLKLKVKNTGNTNLLSWNQRLFALYEPCRPIEVSPDDLSTLGETDLEGLIPRAFS